MADGRMLKKVVSESSKLPKLKTDSARLLWTWILPYLDIEGRCLADPDLIKGKVVPRIKTYTPENIREYLQDMHDVKLIILYSIDGEQYLQFRNFKELQNLRESKEAKSKIPPPPSAPTPEPLPPEDGTTPLEFNLSEFNLSKKQANAPVDNFTIPSKEEIENFSKPMLQTKIESAVEELYSKHIFTEALIFTNKSLKADRNPRAILHTLVQCIEKKPKNPWGYCEQIIKLEDLNYNERDHIRAAQ